MRKSQGGSDALKTMLEELRRFLFSGYVKLDLRKGGTKVLGLVILNTGVPTACYRESGKGKKKEKLQGPAALETLLSDADDEDALLEIHGKVSIDDLEDTFRDATVTERDLAKLGLSFTARKKKAGKAGAEDKRVALSWGLDDKKERFKKELDAMHEEGYEIDVILEELERSPGSLGVLSRRVGETKALMRMLESLDPGGRVEEKERIRNRILAFEDPRELKREVFDFQKRLREDQLTHKLEDQLAKESFSKEREMQVQEIYGLILKHTQSMDKTAGPEAASDAGLNSEMSFDNFVVGPSNEFAVAAAKMVAKSPSGEYNPLFIMSGAGLGKTHLLNAIGNAVSKDMPEKKVKYVTCERFTDELIKALGEGTLPDFRTRYRQVDVLLIDDVQFLAGKEKTQDEMFHTFNELYNNHKQIVASSDRPPKDIPTLGERLVSRFEAGVMADIQSPEFETRVAILEMISKVEHLNLGRDIIDKLAQRTITNVRELKGIVKRLMAFSKLMKTEIDADLVDQMLQQKEESDDILKKEDATDGIINSISYLIIEDKPRACFEKAEMKARAGWSTLVITRTNPKVISTRYRELTKGRIIWLTDKSSSTYDTIEPGLEKIMYIIEEFVRNSDEGIVVLDGVEYLVSNNSFDSVLKFVRSVVDEISESNSTFILSVGGETLEPQETKILLRELESIES